MNPMEYPVWGRTGASSDEREEFADEAERRRGRRLAGGGVATARPR